MAFLAPTSDFITSTLSGAIAAGDSTATVGTGLDLPATNGILQFDYDSTNALGASSGPETVSYATYTSGTGALTGMVRGLNGTTGVSHSNGATVQSGPSASYWGSGSIVSADIGAVLLNANLATTAGEPGGAWLSWAPTYQNLTIGAGGTATAKYTKIGKTILAYFYFKFGTGSAVSGDVSFTLPVAAADALVRTIGTAQIADAGSAYYAGACFKVNDTQARVYCLNVGGTYSVLNALSSTVPMTWTTNDEFMVSIAYDAA